jgi:hypothetical protein
VLRQQIRQKPLNVEHAAKLAAATAAVMQEDPQQAALERPVAPENLTTIIVRGHRTIALALTTDPARPIVPANLTTIAQEPAIVREHRIITAEITVPITIARQTMQDVPAEEPLVLEIRIARRIAVKPPLVQAIRISPEHQIEEQVPLVRTLPTIRKRGRMLLRTTTSHVPVDRTTAPVEMFPAQDRAEPDSRTVGQVGRTAMPVPIKLAPTTVLITDGRITLGRTTLALTTFALTTPGPTTPGLTTLAQIGQIMPPLRSPGHHVRTTVARPLTTVQHQSRTIVRHHQLRTGARQRLQT